MLSFNQSTNLILVQDDCPGRPNESLLRFALGSEPVAGVILGGLSRNSRRRVKRAKNARLPGEYGFGKTFYAIPDNWGVKLCRSQTLRGSDFDVQSDVIYYREDVPFGPELMSGAGRSQGDGSWLVVSNGRFVTQINIELLDKVLAGVRADVLAVNAEPALMSRRERMRLTTEGNVAGFRRVYSDAAEFAFTPEDWPHHLFIILYQNCSA